MAVEATYAATSAAEQEFKLFFDFDKPKQAGWSVSPPSASYRGYLTNQTAPLDTRFESSTGQDPPVTAGPRTQSPAR